MDGHITTLTNSTFDEELAERRQMLVDFWAEGCEPCKTMMPILEDIARDHPGDLAVGSVRLDDAPELARRFEIMALPTFIVFVEGRATKRLTGARSKKALLSELREFLA